MVLDLVAEADRAVIVVDGSPALAVAVVAGDSVLDRVGIEHDAQLTAVGQLDLTNVVRCPITEVDDVLAHGVDSD